MAQYPWEIYKGSIEGDDSVFGRRNACLQDGVGRAAAAVLAGTPEPHGLEFGSGTGGTTRRLLGRVPDLSLRCIDTDAQALHTAWTELSPIFPGRFATYIEDFLTYEPRRLFDLVTGVFVVHNEPDEVKRRFFSKAKHLLSSGGYLLLGDVIPNDDPVQANIEWAFDYAMIAQLPPDDHAFWKEHFDTYDRPRAATLGWHQDALQEAGFTDVQVRHRDGSWTCLSARKP